MQGEYSVKIGNKVFDYTNVNDIPEKFDHLIKLMNSSLFLGFEKYSANPPTFIVV